MWIMEFNYFNYIQFFYFIILKFNLSTLSLKQKYQKYLSLHEGPWSQTVWEPIIYSTVYYLYTDKHVISNRPNRRHWRVNMDKHVLMYSSVWCRGSVCFSSSRFCRLVCFHYSTMNCFISWYDALPMTELS